MTDSATVGGARSRSPTSRCRLPLNFNELALRTYAHSAGPPGDQNVLRGAR